MVAVERRRVETTVGLDRPAVLAELHNIFSHLGPSRTAKANQPPIARRNLNNRSQRRGTFGFSWVRRKNRLTPLRPGCQPMAFMLWTAYIPSRTADINRRKRH
jgi:hypothetical protein